MHRRRNEKSSNFLAVFTISNWLLVRSEEPLMKAVPYKHPRIIIE